MAITQNTLIGQSKQKIGNAVFSTWKGKNVLKSKALAVANPQTDAQMAQRLKFTWTIALFRSLISVVERGFKSQAVGITEMNAFSRHTLKNCFSGVTPETVVFNPEYMLISKGSIGVVPITGVSGADDGQDELTVQWDNTLAPVGSSVSDIALIAVIDSDRNVLGTRANVARSVGNATISLNRNMVESETLVVYLGFSSPDSSTASDSAADTVVVQA